ncbi:MAG: glycosyltransferase [Bacteroidales bacterium]|jgi:glycosyltransferase involved in cell wall biosynthesis|nr:glycosyltransferase [Bacteroidales bacterium]
MNIVFLLRFWPVYGGGETVTRILTNKFSEQGYNVSVIYLWDRRQKDMPCINDRIKEHKISNISAPCGIEQIHKSNYKNIATVLKDYIKYNHVDIIINQWLPVRIVHKAIKGTKIKLICPHHSAVFIEPVITTIRQRVFYTFFGQKGKNFNIWRRLYPSYKYADKFIVLAQVYLDDCRKLFKTKNRNKKIMVINNPLPFNDFIDNKRMDKKKKEILFVGRIYEPVKRITYILDAWKLLQNKEKTRDWKLYIVGDGPNLDSLKKHAESSTCRDVFFTGRQNPIEYYRRASIFLMTSLFEGWAMTLIEAQQNGCVPVVMDSFQSLPEIIQGGINGLIVPNNDIPAFAEATEKLIANDELRLKLAYKGIETCKKFSVDNIAKQWEVLFSELKKQ